MASMLRAARLLRARASSLLTPTASPALQQLEALGSLSAQRCYATRSQRTRAAEALRQRRREAAASEPPASRSSLPSRAVDANEPHAPALVPFTDAALTPVFSNSALVVTREIEWGTVVLGFEQANKYTIRNADGAVVAFLAEETNSMASAVGRQLLRRRRPFTATLLSPAGDVIFRVRRPMYLINSSTTIEDSAGETVGEIVQVWHLWKRNYDLFIHNEQFGRVRSGLLAWEFELQDAQGSPMARIDRNFQGFGKELFTDAGCYALHFGEALGEDEALVRPVGGQGGAAAATAPSTAGSSTSSESATTQTGPGGSSTQLVPSTQDTWQLPAVGRTLELTERAACLALAIAVDFDYFSQHSSGPGLLPLGGMGGGMGVPIPVPFPGGGGGEASASVGADATEEASSSGASEDSAPPPPAEKSWHDKENLGGDDGSFRADEQRATWSDSAPEEPEDDGGWGDDDADDGGDDEGGGGGLSGLFGTLNEVFGNRE